MPLVALRKASSQQATETENTNKAINRCLCYLLKFINGTITYTVSNVVLLVYSDGSYLVEDGTKSIAGSHYFLSGLIKEIDKAQPKFNGPIHAL